MKVMAAGRNRRILRRVRLSRGDRMDTEKR